MARFIDAHTHSYLRGLEDLQAMAGAGVHGLVVCAFLPVRPSGPETLRDLFAWLAREERGRIERLGMAARVALGIHPRCIPDSGLAEALDTVARQFEDGAAQVLGEVGLESGDGPEREVLAAQLRIAKAFRAPVVLHTPRKGKEAAFEATVEILEAEEIDPRTVILDHLTPELAERARASGALAGLTLQPGKTTAAEVAALIGRIGAGGLVANSDLSHAPSDPLAVPKLAAALAAAGVAEPEVEKVVYSNVAALMQF